MNNTIPARTLPAYTRNYCVFNRLEFVDLLNHINDVLSEEFNEQFTFEISISNFDFPFSTPEAVTKVLTKEEWRRLNRIDVKLFKESDKNHAVVDLQFGGTIQYSNSSRHEGPIAFKCTVRSGTTSQKVATKERIRLLTEDYARKPIHPLIAVSIVATAFYLLALAVNAIIRHRLGYGLLADSIQDAILVAPLLGFLVGLAAHGILFPSIEFIEESAKTKWQKANGHFFSLLAVVGLILTILSFLPPNGA